MRFPGTRWRSATVGGALLVGLLAPMGPAASAPDPAQARVADTESDSVAPKNRRGSLRLKVAGDLGGKRAVVVLRGLSGPAEGVRKTVKTRQSTVVRHLRPGRYRVTAAAVSTDQGQALATVRPPRVRVRAQHRSQVRVRYRVDDESDQTGRNTLLGTVDVGGQVEHLSLSPDGSRAYASLPSAFAIAVFDTRADSKVSTISGNNPQGSAVSPDGKTLYFADTEPGTGKGVVESVDTATGKRTGASIRVGVNPWNVALSPDGTRLYAANSGERTISVIDTATRTVVRTAQVCSNPLSLAVSPDGRSVYAACNGSGDLATLNPDTGTVRSVAVGPGARGVALSPDGGRAYVSSAGLVSTVDTGTNRVTGKIRVGTLASDIAATPDGANAYTVIENEDMVEDVDLVGRKREDEVKPITRPRGVAITPDGAKVLVGGSLGISIISVTERAPRIASVALSGTPAVGAALTAGTGTITSVPFPYTVRYQWQRAAAPGGPFTDITGATSPTYSPSSSDAGQYIRVAATASNAQGTGTAFSVATAAIVPVQSPTTNPGPGPTGSPGPTPGPTTNPNPNPSPTASPTPSPKQTAGPSVRVKAKSGKSRLFVKITPSPRGAKNWTFQVQTKKKGKWQTQAKKYTTTGKKQTRTIDLGKGQYRVVVPPSYGYAGSTSKAVRLKR